MTSPPLNPLTREPFHAAIPPAGSTDVSSPQYRAAWRALLSAAATGAASLFPSRAYSFTDLLCAYAHQRADGLPTYEAAAAIVQHVAAEYVAPEECVFALAQLCEDFPLDAVNIAGETVYPVHSLAVLLVETDIPGLLRRDVFDVVFTRHCIDRRSYLLYRLACRTQPLSREQLEFAETLTLSWDGTLASLIDTVCELRPKTPASA